MMIFKSNLGRTCQIGWLRRDWDAGGGAGRRKRHSRGGPSPEMVKLGRPGLDSSGAMAWEWVRIMRNPLGPTSGLGVARSGERDCGSGERDCGSGSALASAYVSTY